MPKKKKKTKAELEAERLAQEEEARKAEEEKQKRLEAERKRAEEEARLLKEKRAAYRVEEISRMNEEIETAAAGLEARAQELRGAECEVEERENWEQYLKCYPGPDASSERDLNTYISEQKDNVITSLEDTLKQCEYTESVVANLNDALAHALVNEDEAQVAMLQDFRSKLRQMSCDKLDRATAHLLQHWDEMDVDPEADKLSTERGGIRFGVWCNMALKSFRMKTIDFASVCMSSDLPRPLSTAKIALSNTFLPYEYIPLPRPTHPLKMMVLGGTFILDLLALPPGVRCMRGWTFRPETELSEQIQRQTYPLDGGHVAVAPPLRAQYVVPDGVIIPERPTVCAWDAEVGHWTDNGIEEVEWHAANRLVRFKTLRVGVMAIVQGRGSDLAYQSWGLRPVFALDDDTPKVELSLQTPRFRVVIHVKRTLCSVIEPDFPELASVREREMSPGQVVQALSAAGICVAPVDADAEHVQVSPGTQGLALKQKRLEQSINQQVAAVCSSYELKSSRWNCTMGTDRCVFQIRETSVFAGGDEDMIDFQMALMELDEASDSANHAPGLGSMPQPGIKCSLVTGSETDKPAKPLCTDLLPGEDTHAYLITCLANSSCTEAVERARNTDVRFQKTVSQLLHLIRPFSFS
ncbi:unnamed protein product [Chrysoparadoxa australica]